MDRRESIKSLALVPLATTIGWSTSLGKRSPSDLRADQGPNDQHPPGTPYTYPEAPRFFSDHEFETVTVLSDWIIPADERSGSASEAHVPGFIDYTMVDQPWQQTPVRGGLAWLDAECRSRFGRPFVDCDDSDQRETLDRIAYPESAGPEMQYGVVFFNRFRNLVASGFWTSKMGIEDLEYMGNEYVANWTGCPSEVHEAIRSG